MYKRKLSLTARKLQDMLRENTGRHILDSGGAYGRNWERNQKVDFEAQPDAWVELHRKLNVRQVGRRSSSRPFPRTEPMWILAYTINRGNNRLDDEWLTYDDEFDADNALLAIKEQYPTNLHCWAIAKVTSSQGPGGEPLE